MAIKVYEYAKCTTCQKARKYLDGRKVKYEVLPIKEKPPTRAELKRMLAYLKGDVRKLFNTSGQLYRELGLSAKLPQMTEADALELLTKQGMLVKRPFVLTDEAGLVGFKTDQWKGVFG